MPHYRIILAITFVVTSVGPAAGQGYTFQLLASSTTAAYNQGFGQPAVNAGGAVAFHGVRTTGGGIYTVAGGTTTTVADSTTAAYAGGFVDPSINAGGRVAFGAYTANFAAGGVYARTGTGGTTTVESGNAGVGVPSIGTTGAVGFLSFDAAGVARIKTGTGGPPTIIAASNGGVFSDFGSPVLGSAGAAVFTGTKTAGEVGVYSVPAGTTAPTTLATAADSRFAGGFGAVAVGGVGTVAFEATDAAGGQGVYRVSGGTTAQIARTGTTAFAGAFFSGPAVNASGLVAFRAIDQTAGGAASGVYVSDGTTVKPVLLDSNTLGGQGINSVTVGPFGLSDGGLLALNVSFDGGTSAIYLATPVPEPAGPLAAAGGLLLGWRRKNRAAGGHSPEVP